MKTLNENSSDCGSRGQRARNEHRGHGHAGLAAALLGVALLPSLATWHTPLSLSSLSQYVEANPVALRPPDPAEEHVSADFLKPSESDAEPEFDDVTQNYAFENQDEADDSAVRHLIPRTYVYNQILNARSTTPFRLPVPPHKAWISDPQTATGRLPGPAETRGLCSGIR